MTLVPSTIGSTPGRPGHRACHSLPGLSVWNASWCHLAELLLTCGQFSPQTCEGGRGSLLSVSCPTSQTQVPSSVADVPLLHFWAGILVVRFSSSSSSPVPQLSSCGGGRAEAGRKKRARGKFQSPQTTSSGVNGCPSQGQRVMPQASCQT